MNKLLRSEEGAASVLVIMIMVVMVVFGLLSLMTVRGEDRLALKSAQWQKDYYSLDAKGEEFVFDIATIVDKAQADATSYIDQKKYKLTHVDYIADDMQARTKNRLSATPPDETRLKLIQKNVFFVFLKQHLSDINKSKNTTVAFKGADVIWGNFILDGQLMSSKPVTTISADFTSDNNSAASLTVELECVYPSEVDKMPSFEINKWTLKNKPFEYREQDLNLWNGK
jgi:hypothetical protein